MSGRGPLPDALRRAIERDRRPVRPLRPAGQRAALVAAWAIALVAVLPFVFGLRGDMAALGPALAWGATALEGALGIVLVAMALREAVPGAGIPIAGRALAAGGGIAAQALVAALCWLGTGRPHGSFPPAGAACFPTEGVLGLPALALTAVLVARAYAVRPRWAGLLGGLGAGLTTDAAWHLICPHNDLEHVLLLHGGAVLALAAVGWLAGAAAEASRRRRLAHDA